MRHLIAVTTMLVTIIVASTYHGTTQAGQPAAGPVTAIRGGTVIDVRTGALQADAVIVLEGDRIASVGPAAQVQVPASATVIDATGRFIVPGLWDTHAHTRDFDGDLNIHHGVTSTMDMGNLMDWIMVVKEAREKGMWVGPRIFPQGMSIGGRLGPHQWAATTVDEAVFGAKQNIAAGVSFLKAYSNATPEMIKAVADIAHAAGLNLHSHLGRANAREAVLAGVDGIAHGSGIAAATSTASADAGSAEGEGGRGFDRADPEKFDELVKLMVDRGVRLEPNIVGVYHGSHPKWDAMEVETLRVSMLPQMHYLREKYEVFQRMWHTDFTFRPYPPTPEVATRLRKALANHELFTRKFAEAGGKLLVGTDNYYHVIAGLGVWHEMELLADAGVAPLKILQGATINPAEFVKQDKALGTVEAGKLADLLILGKNPLLDIKNIRSLETVIQHGKVQKRGLQSEYRVLIPRPFLPHNGQLPVPHISSVSPVAVPVGTKNLVVTITGTNFNRLNRVIWDQTDLAVLELSPTELKAAVPDDLLARIGTWKVHMVTGGRAHLPSDNSMEIMVTLGKRIEQRFNGQRMGTVF